MKKAAVVLIHLPTSLVIGTTVLTHMFFFYDYTVSDLVKCIVTGILLLCVDYFACKAIMRKGGLSVERPKLLHGADLIFSVPPGAFLLQEAFIDCFVERVQHASTYSAEEHSFTLVFVLGVLLVEALLIIERRKLMKLSRLEK